MFDGNSTLKQPPILTEREKEVLPFLLSGATRIEIAQTLSVSSETVKFHTRQLLKKFGVKTVPEGYTVMQEYARLYLPEGMNFNYFIKSARTTVHIQDNRTDAKLVKEWNVLAIKSEVLKFKSAQNYCGSVKVVSVNGVENNKVTTEAWRHIISNNSESVCAAGDELVRVLDYEVTNLYPALEENHAIKVGLPVGELSLKIIFPEGQTPQNVWFEQSKMNRPVEDPAACFEATKEYTKIFVPDAKFENRYAIHWRWVE